MYVSTTTPIEDLDDEKEIDETKSIIPAQEACKEQPPKEKHTKYCPNCDTKEINITFNHCPVCAYDHLLSYSRGTTLNRKTRKRLIRNMRKKLKK